MIIILDTNVYQKDYRVRTPAFAVLKRYIANTKSRVFLPRIVREELLANYGRDIKRMVSVAKRSIGELNSALIEGIKCNIPELELEIELKRYFKFLSNELSIGDADIIDYKPDYLAEVVSRAVNRRRPCNDKGEEIRDAILWCTILDIAKEHKNDIIAFVSENIRQFGDSNGLLHQDLINEISKKVLKIEYYRSLDEFAKAHAERVDFITTEWLSSSVNLMAIVYEIAPKIEEQITKRIAGKSKYSRVFNGDAIVTNGHLDIESYYVYRSVGDAMSVEIEARGEIEVECGMAKKENDPDFIDFESRCAHDSRPKYLYSELELILDAEIQNKKVVDVQVVSYHVSVGWL